MKSRRVHRVRAAQRQAQDVVETYRASHRGLDRVFQSILPAEDPSAGLAAARAAHHLAQVEALLPRVREAIRSCRYPGAEHGDPGALIWGLWSHLSEALLHTKGALQSLEVLGHRYRFREEAEAAAVLRKAARAAGGTGGRRAAKRTAKKRGTTGKR
jgi:hypothetical protein